MLEARVRVTDHALIFAFLVFFTSFVGSTLQEIVRNKGGAIVGMKRPSKSGNTDSLGTDYAKEKILGSQSLL